MRGVRYTHGMGKKLFWVLLLTALVSGIAAPPARTPATALAPEYAIALPSGSERRTDGCGFGTATTYCFEVPVDVFTLVHSISGQFRNAGYDLLEEEVLDPVAEYGFSVEDGTVLMHQLWRNQATGQHLSVQYTGSLDRTLITVVAP